MKRIFLCCLMAGLFIFRANAQELVKIIDTSYQQADSIYQQFQWVDYNGHGTIELVLFKSNRYVYNATNFNWASYSSGIWVLHQKELELTSEIQAHDVPVKVMCDTFIAASKDCAVTFDIPVNLSGDRLSDARIFINNDQNIVFPFFDQCYSGSTGIDSIKVDFGYGFYSSWLQLGKRQNQHITITALTRFELATFEVFRHRKYHVVENKLILQND